MNPKNTPLNKRQDAEIAFIEKQEIASVSQILEFIKKDFTEVSKITINRDLSSLLKINLITKKGKGRSVVYSLSPYYNLIKPIDAEKYFQVEIDLRKIRTRFDFDVFEYFEEIFTSEENQNLENLTNRFKKNIKALSAALLKKEFERLTIDLSWKSSQIEGNTYSLLETEELIKDNRESKRRSKEEAVMILNHKKALDFIRRKPEQFKRLTVAKIEDIHHLLMRGLGVKRNLRQRAVGITGTNYKPLDNEYQIREALEKMCQIINREKNPFAKALGIIVLISYIQPFEDGNKRTARLMGDAVLLAFGCCPLSFRSVDKIEYKKAILLFYEQNNLSYFKKLFIEQYEFAAHNYFGA